MSKSFLVPINLNKNELQNAVLQNLGTAPSSPSNGQLYWDTVAQQAFYWNATTSSWQWKATDSALLQGQNGAYYLARANHTGTQLAATISNFQSTVLGYTLDTFATPVASVNLGGQNLINLGAPVNSGDATTKQYVDATIQGLNMKPSAKAMSFGNLGSCTYAAGPGTGSLAGIGATLTAVGTSAPLVVDGVTVASNDVVLVTNESPSSNNGLYTVTNPGGFGAWVLTRHVDMDQGTEFTGAFIAVEGLGLTRANTVWLCSNPNPTVGTSGISFSQLNAATVYTSGNGINISGLVVSAVVQSGGGLVNSSSGLAIDTTSVVRKYATAVGDGTSTSITVTHGLNTQDVTVGLYSATTPFNEVVCDVNHATVNTVTLIFATAPTSNQYRVVIRG